MFAQIASTAPRSVRAGDPAGPGRRPAAPGPSTVQISTASMPGHPHLPYARVVPAPQRQTPSRSAPAQLNHEGGEINGRRFDGAHPGSRELDGHDLDGHELDSHELDSHERDSHELDSRELDGPGFDLASALATAEPETEPAPSGLLRRWIKRFEHLIHEVGKFGVVGAIAFMVDFSVFNLLLSPIGPLPAKTVSTVISASVAFVGNRFWTWRHRPRSGLGREYSLRGTVHTVDGRRPCPARSSGPSQTCAPPWPSARAGSPPRCASTSQAYASPSRTAATSSGSSCPTMSRSRSCCRRRPSATWPWSRAATSCSKAASTRCGWRTPRLSRSASTKGYAGWQTPSRRCASGPDCRNIDTKR